MWDRLGPGTLCWDLGPFSSSNKVQRNYKGLKITACMHIWGKFCTKKIQRDQKTQLPLLKSLEQ